VTVSASVAYAFTLGLIAAVNPCGFPLLPGYLALFARREDRTGRGPRTIAALIAGGCVTLGFIAVFSTVGLLASVGAQWIIATVPWFMILFGAALAVLGVAGLLGRQLRISLPTIRFRAGTGAIAMAGFGVAYAVGSLTCALPLFVAGVAGTFTRLGLLPGIATFAAYALGMGTLVTGLALITVHASGELSRRLRRASRFVPVIANTLEAIVGLYLVFYWVTDLINPLSITAATRTVGAIQGAISGVVSDSPIVIGCALGATVIAGFAIAAWSTRRRPLPDTIQPHSMENSSDGH
jgi:cytochrome c-type biogenesis protein